MKNNPSENQTSDAWPQWDEAVASKLSYAPDQLTWNAEPKSKPGPDGVYPCATPGVTQVL